MSLPQTYLDEYDEPFGFMDFASVGAMSRRARERVRHEIEWMSGAEGKIVPIILEHIDATKLLVAELIGTDPGHVTVIPNTSSGLFAVAFGLSGGSVVVPSTEFPANLYPWIRAGEAGRIEPRFVTSSDGRYAPEVFAAAVDSTTTAVAVSQVDYQTGYRVDLAAVRDAVGDALVVVDSVQALGAIGSPFAHADVVVAGGQKWLRSGIGIGVMAMSDRAMDRLETTFTGWLGVEDPFGLETSMPHSPVSNPDRYTMGSGPITAMAGLRGALESLRMAPIVEVESVVIDRAQTAADEIRAAGGELFFSWNDDAERSGIVSFRRPDEPSTVTNARMEDAGFVLTERNGWLRVSPHASTHPDAPAAMAQVLKG